MERIGFAASKIAKGNLFLYNVYVVFFSFLFSILLFFISGSSIFFALVCIGYVMKFFWPSDMMKEWFAVIKICMVSLTIIVGSLTVYAVKRNIKFRLTDSIKE